MIFFGDFLSPWNLLYEDIIGFTFLHLLSELVVLISVSFALINFQQQKKEEFTQKQLIITRYILNNQINIEEQLQKHFNLRINKSDSLKNQCYEQKIIQKNKKLDQSLNSKKYKNYKKDLFKSVNRGNSKNIYDIQYKYLKINYISTQVLSDEQLSELQRSSESIQQIVRQISPKHEDVNQKSFRNLKYNQIYSLMDSKSEYIDSNYQFRNQEIIPQEYLQNN